MGQICFNYNDAIATDLRQALLEEHFTPAQIDAMTGAQKTEEARMTIVNWVRASYREWKQRQAGSEQTDIT